jgi:serine/threonine protein kinase
MVGENRNEWPIVPGYTLTCVIGRGNYGIVWEAENNDDQVRLRRAVKVFRPRPLVDEERGKRRLAKEIEVLARLGQHPQIVQYVASSTTQGKNGRVPYVVMNFVDGESLATRRGRLTRSKPPKSWSVSPRPWSTATRTR